MLLQIAIIQIVSDITLVSCVMGSILVVRILNDVIVICPNNFHIAWSFYEKKLASESTKMADSVPSTSPNQIVSFQHTHPFNNQSKSHSALSSSHRIDASFHSTHAEEFNDIMIERPYAHNPGSSSIPMNLNQPIPIPHSMTVPMMSHMQAMNVPTNCTSLLTFRQYLCLPSLQLQCSSEPWYDATTSLYFASSSKPLDSFSSIHSSHIVMQQEPTK